MKTTVMFVADAVPLGGVSVRLAGEDDELTYVADNEGKIDVDLAPGTHTFAVHVDDVWVERTVRREGSSPLFVVNVRDSTSDALHTLNTLQIDLTNLVGDRYVFETVLGRGGMGVVVKAIDRMLNRPVAIKMLSDELRENEEAQQIFLVEARNLATLSHPNLVAIHDILSVGGRVLMIFEYVLGENVEKTIKRRGPLDQKDVLRIAIQLTRCLCYLHEHELIHRDLKPANIIMQADGTLKLIDFGLARSLNELYVRGTRVRGTPAYMAPEQIQGIHLTTATDIYQIGISMYEMLAGKLPFPTGDMAYAHVHLDPPPLTDAVNGIDPELANLVHNCLEKSAKDRPASANILLEQLREIYARLASAESQSFLAFDPTDDAPTSPAHPTPAPVLQANSELEYDGPAMGDVSLAQEMIGGSNRGLAIMAIVGLLALGAGYVMLNSGDEPTEVAAPSAPPAAIVDTPPEEPDDVEPEAADPSVAAARGLVGLSLSEALQSARTPTAVATTARPRAKKSTRRPKVVKSRPVEKPPAAAPKPAEPVATAAVEPEAQVAAEPPPEPKPKRSSGLLSVDSDTSSKSLLPVK